MTCFRQAAAYRYVDEVTEVLAAEVPELARSAGAGFISSSELPLLTAPTHPTKQRWNDADKWIYSEQVVHPPIIDGTTFTKAQGLLTARRGVHRPHKLHHSKHHTVLSGLLFCGLCDRRMQGHWANAAPYYRCRFPV